MDDLGKSLPASEGMVDAEQSREGAHPNENCLNCGAKLVDSYCHHCGQKDIPRRQTLGELFSNFISSFWSYEGRFFRTTLYLITRPGFLAAEYNAGRRESYYHPARMYVFISFVFFLLFFSLPDEDITIEMTKEDLGELRDELKESGLDSLYANMQDSVLLDSIQRNPGFAASLGINRKGKYNLSQSKYPTIARYDSAQMAKPEDERDGWFVRRMTIRLIELNQKYKNDMGRFGRDFRQAFSDNFSKVLFYLLPLFALLLKLLYVRRDYFYAEHLVLSIYYYNFFYLAASVMMIIDLVPAIGFISTIIGFWIYFYFLFAMKRMYQQPWSKTILKFLLFSLAFSFLVLVGVGINAMATLMII